MTDGLTEDFAHALATTQGAASQTYTALPTSGDGVLIAAAILALASAIERNGEADRRYREEVRQAEEANR